MTVAVLALALLAGTAWAYPTRFGPATGLVDLPTSDVALPGGAEFAVDYSRLESGQQVWPIRLLVGVSDRAELGFSYARLKGTVDDDITGFGTKMTLMEEPQANFGFAVGASFLQGTARDILDIYAVASKEFPMAEPEAYRWQEGRARMRGHLGVMFTHIRNGPSDDEVKPFLGFDVTTPEGTSFVAEYKFTKFGDDHVAAAVRYPLSPAVTVQAGVARAGAVLGQDDYRFLVGVNYNFTVPAKAEARD
jgi:hypothetical protein